MMEPLGETDMSDLEALKERVRILEQRSRRLRIVGIGLALSIIASLAFAQQRQGTAQRIPDVIEAKRFVLKDDKGFERAVLETTPAGTSSLSLYGPDGRRVPIAFLSAMWDNDHKKGKSYSYADDFEVSHEITAKRLAIKSEAVPRAVLEDRGFGPHLEMYRQDGKTLTASFGSTINDDGFVFLIGKRNVIQIDGSSVQLSEFADKRQLTRRAALGSVELEDAKTGTVTTQPVSSLVLFDKEGKVLFRAP
jgi:hypothetical protein